jgi:5-methylcytosine-specific restriction protein B
MSSPTKDWRVELTSWLTSNPKQTPSGLQQLRQAFVQRFPREQLPSLALEEYVLGKPDSFCWWLEFKTHPLGSVAGGSSSKWGIWWSKGDQQWKWNKAFRCSDPEEAFTRIRSGLVSLLETAALDQFDQLEQIGSSQLGPNRNGLRAKPLYLYFPDKFLPISNPTT